MSVYFWVSSNVIRVHAYFQAKGLAKFLAVPINGTAVGLPQGLQIVSNSPIWAYSKAKGLAKFFAVPRNDTAAGLTSGL